MTARSLAARIRVGIVLLITVGAWAQASPGGRFGRRWFNRAPDREIAGFVNGYYDCLSSPAVRNLPGWDASDEIILKRVENYYAKHPNSRLSVGGVAMLAARQPPPHTGATDGEVYSGRHGYFDGLWWAGARAKERRGYIEGYLYGLGHTDIHRLTPRLLAAMNVWYAAHPRHDDRPLAIALQQVMQRQGLPLIPPRY